MKVIHNSRYGDRNPTGGSGPGLLEVDRRGISVLSEVKRALFGSDRGLRIYGTGHQPDPDRTAGTGC
jgi:hypothetical protein